MTEKQKPIVLEFEGKKYTHFKGSFKLSVDNNKGIYPVMITNCKGTFKDSAGKKIYDGYFNIEIIEESHSDIWRITEKPPIPS